jgi:hypothetical protein
MKYPEDTVLQDDTLQLLALTDAKGMSRCHARIS